MSDGSVIASMYNESVHFLENNEWTDVNTADVVEIDRQDTLVTFEENTEQLNNNLLKKNTKNKNFKKSIKDEIKDKKRIEKQEVKKALKLVKLQNKVEIAEDSTSSELIKINNGSKNISFSLLDTNKVALQKENKEQSVAFSATKNKESANKEIYEEMKVSDVSTNVKYENIYNKVDVKYTVTSNKIKEDIILKDKTSQREFVFEFKTNGLKALLNADKSVSIFNENIPEEIEYIIQSPLIYDKALNDSIDLEVTLEENANGYIFFKG